MESMEGFKVVVLDGRSARDAAFHMLMESMSVLKYMDGGNVDAPTAGRTFHGTI
jgi:hypothetical protein